MFTGAAMEAVGKQWVYAPSDAEVEPRYAFNFTANGASDPRAGRADSTAVLI